MGFQWNEFEHANQAAQALADQVADELQKTLAENGRAVLAVSGGRSPIAFFEALSKKQLDWQNVAITLADERIVPTDHADSNTGLVHEFLLKNEAAKAEWLPLIEQNQTDLEPESVVSTALKHFRRPDVVVLGMGPDGHTASLFPQAPQLSDGLSPNYPQPLLHTTPVTAPHERISLTLAAILNARAVFLAINGQSKKEVFDKASAGLNRNYPVSYVLNQKDKECYVYYTA